MLPVQKSLLWGGSCEHVFWFRFFGGGGFFGWLGIFCLFVYLVFLFCSCYFF